MIDLNTLISNALIAAVQQAVAPLVERIAKLELCNAESHQRLLVLEGALTDRVVALENNPAQGVDTSVVAGSYTPVSNEQVKAALQEWATKDTTLMQRIAALENNPAQGVDTQAEYATAHDIMVLREQLGALGAAPTTDITRHIIDALSDTDHPLFKRMSSFMDAVAEQAMDHHLECYNHDSYDEATSKVDDYDFDDFVKTDYLEDAVREAVSNLSFDISVS